jgi:hypothetical protein
MNWITFDIETYSPGKLTHIDTKEFRVSVTGAYFSWLDKYIAFFEEDTKDFLALLLEADVVVGFNHIWFDLAVLQKYSHIDLPQFTNNYDIMLEVEKKLGFKVKLNDLLKANMDGDLKTDSYAQYKDYYWDGKWFELVDYCMNDVRLTNELFLKILAGETLKYNDLTGVKEFVLELPTNEKKKRTGIHAMESFF